MCNNPVPLHRGTVGIAPTRITIFASLLVSLVILIPEVNEFFRSISQRVTGECNTESSNSHEGEGLDCVDAGDSSVKTNAIFGSLVNSAVNLGPDITGSDQRNDDDNESPQLPRKDNNNFQQVLDIAKSRPTCVIVVESTEDVIQTIREANTSINGVVNNECCNSQA